ncbi:MAG: DUF1800 domain-containing protein [Acidobacteriota bacterium]|nr:DUF1800 domain-containing protein [Acidobacteriota bacterium]MDH3529104.1 DUF1800 domain-containing protein [Acidobacteriota bacterium]
MKSRKLFVKVLLSGLAASILAASVIAQIDPNPNSPTPVLLAGPGHRALVSDSSKARFGLPAPIQKAYAPESEPYIFINNIQLLEDEKENGFRVYATDAKNRMYRFPVTDIIEIPRSKQVYALRIKLKDEIGFWPQPSPTGDLLIQVTWRGLGSNKLLLGLGRTGGLKFEPRTNLYKTEFGDTESEYVGYRYSGDRKRFLEQATFGPTWTLDQRVRRIGLRVWLAEQLNAPYPSSSNPYPDIPLKPNSIQVGCPDPRGTPEYIECQRLHYTQIPLMNWFFKEAFYGEPQLRHRVAWALSQLWVTSGQTIQQSSHMIAYHKILSQHAFGNYRNLMKDMTLNPAMGDYLDMARSTKNNPNENYAREILQLFTVGLFMLNQDGTLQTDTGGNPIPTYDQERVNNFTKVFTGFSFCNIGCPNSTAGAINFKDPLILNQNNHNVEAKSLLSYPNAVNQNIGAGLNGNTELDLALDNIFYHPNVGPFVSKFLIQHMVTSDPTPAYVGRVAAVFNNNGAGVRGDLKAVVRAILLDPEARGDEKTDPNFGKLREPVQQVTNFYRHFNVQSADGTGPSDGVVWQLPQLMSQLPFYANTVFNYYTPNYVVPGTSLLAPEFGILNTGSAIQRTNAATIMSFVPLVPDGGQTPIITEGTSINVDDLIQLSANDPTGGQLLDELDRKMMHSTMSPEMRQEIIDAMLVVPSSENDFRVRTALFLIASSSQFQIQR